MRLQRRNLHRGLAGLSALALLSAGALAGAVASSGATGSTPEFSATKTISRINLNNGKDDIVEQHQFHLTVSQTSNLRNEQQVSVSWTGAHPTAGIASNPNSAPAAGQEYPMVLLECRGTDSSSVAAAQQLSPQTCWTISSAERYADDPNFDFPVWRLDRYETPADRALVVGEPTPLPTACTPAQQGEARRYVHFVAANGADYPFGQSGCAGTPPEATDYNTSIEPSNETYAVTNTDGTGSTNFDVWTDQTNTSLGCAQGVACAIVAVPILGISCDPTAASLPAADRPSSEGEQQQAASQCEANGNIAPGGNAGGNNKPAATVTGTYWWSASNWRNRISVPLSFASPITGCTLTGGVSSLAVYGAELMTEAAAQWAPHFCSGSNTFALKHVQTGEPQATALLNSGSVEAAFDSQPPATGYSTPTVNAPTALTGFAVTYQVDGTNGVSYPNLRLTPRLLAKLLTESYSIADYLKADYPYLANNPLNLADDPEFQALNPGVPKSVDYQVASTILFASDQSDVMTALTSYINADPEARAWLNGTPDPWGTTVNPAYKNIALPVSSWPLLDTTVRQDVDVANDPCDYYNPVPFLPLVQAPVTNDTLVTQHMEFSNPNDQVICNINQQDVSASKLGPEPRQAPGHRFMLGITTLADAQRYGIPVAQLETNTSSQAPTKFTDATGRTFAGATTDGIAAAGQQLAYDKSTGVWQLDYAALRSNPDNAIAYPGTMLEYTSVPVSGLPSADASDYAAFLRYVTTTGQTPGTDAGDLAAGYVPLTAQYGMGAFAAYASTAATAIAGQTGTVPDPSAVAGTSTTSSSGKKSSTSGGKSSGSGSTPASGGSTATSAPAGSTAESGGAAAPTASAGSSAAPAAGGSSKAPATSGDTGTDGTQAAADVVRTPSLSSGAAAWIIPALLGLALLSGIASVGLRGARA